MNKNLLLWMMLLILNINCKLTVKKKCEIFFNPSEAPLIDRYHILIEKNNSPVIDTVIKNTGVYSFADLKTLILKADDSLKITINKKVRMIGMDTIGISNFNMILSYNTDKLRNLYSNYLDNIHHPLDIESFTDSLNKVDANFKRGYYDSLKIIIKKDKPY